MTNARAMRTSESKDDKPIRPIRDPSVPAPERYQPTEKSVGSKVLKLGRWYEVQPDGNLKPAD